MCMLEIHDYKIIDILYQNTQTIAYQALRKTDQQKFILKTQKSEFPSLKEISKLQHEYEMIKDRYCEGIIHAEDIIRYQNRLFLVLEDIHGKTLDEIISQRKNLNLSDFLPIAIQLAFALEKLHENGIIHKDIKPSNIMVDSNWNVKLIDFSISSKLAFETQNMVNPNVLEGSLLYLSPEQTGRMNRLIDYRTDFYSLGVTFYEMLTGKCPFEGLDALELIYFHLAKFPPSIHEINLNVPPMVSSIVQKLMAKSADDRYSSAYGLKMDLLKLQQGETSFQIGEHDKKNVLHVSQTLYGRDREIQALFSIFKRVCESGNSELVLVAGNSGVGKSAFIGEVYKPLSKEQGYFIKGKFDLLQRTDPYTAFIQAFKELIAQFLADQEDKLAKIRGQILEALGPNAGVITEFLPELELIIGTQSPPIKLPPLESQNRFNYVFGQFIAVFAKKEHPSLIFLDDLQWADQSSLNLIEYFLPRSNKYIFMTGAYRSNEVGPDHILNSALNTLKNSGVNLATITLEPLSYENVKELISDTFKETNVEDLAQIVFEKTGGTPFFINEFLKTLYQEKLLYFLEGKWHWNQEQIIAKNYSSNVVDLMVANIQKLSKPAQETLIMAACIGSQFDLKTLSLICQKSMQEIASLIWEAMKAGLIMNSGGSYKEAAVIPEDSLEVIEYKFLHDRIQEAAYQFISKEKSQEVHLQIGKLLLQNQGEQNLFAVVSHFNCGLSLLKDTQEKIDVANLNLKAAYKAKASNAYKEALTFANAGISLLPPNSWKDLYSLTFNLEKEAAENKFLLKRMEEAEAQLFELIKASQNILDKADIYYLLITLYSIKDPDKGVSYAIEILEELGLHFPKKVNKSHVLLQLIKLQIVISLKSKETLINLPTLTSPKLLKSLEIIEILSHCSIFSSPLYFALSFLKDAEFHLRYGFTEKIVTAFVGYLIIMINNFHAFKLGRYWLDTIVIGYISRTKHVPSYYYAALCWNINYWYMPVHSICALAKKGMQVAIENGDLNFYFVLGTYYFNFYYVGGSLREILNACNNFNLESSKAVAAGYYYMAQCLVYLINLFLGTELYDQSKVNYYIKNVNNSMHIGAINLFFISYFYIMENHEEAYSYLEKYEPIEDVHLAFILSIYAQTFKGLILVNCYKNTSFSQRFSVRRKLKKVQKFLKLCSDQQSYNFSPHYYLVSAQIASLGNNLEKTIKLYNQAVDCSLTSENWQFAALANENAAKFLLKMQQPKLAKSYMQEAHYYYNRWEAFAKVKLLEETYPQWFKEERKETGLVDTLSSTTTRAGNLDYLSIIKSTQALSSEIILNKLLEKLMRILLENAGAQRGLLLMERGEKLYIEAEGYSGEVSIKKQPLENRKDIPLSLIHYVERTKENIILHQATEDERFSKDPYIQENCLKSVICSPILYQNKAIGFLYLENNATVGAFTKERIEALSVLSTQAAISIENAQFYFTLEEKVADRTKELNQTLLQLKLMQNQLIQKEKLASLGLLTSGIAHELKNPLNFIHNFSYISNNEIEDALNDIKNLNSTNFSEILLNLKEKLSRIDAHSKRADKIIQGMLVHSRQVTSKAELIDIHSHLDQVLKLITQKYSKIEEGFTITVVKEYDPLLKKIEGFPAQLDQVFDNIIDNACYALFEQFKKRGSNFIARLEVSTQYLKDQFIIKIKDNGLGISKESLNRIFEPFFTTKPPGSGTGLGLFFVHDIISKQHNGTIEVKSEPDQSTEFIITLPTKQLESL